MSLGIRPEEIEAVLLQDGWHHVTPGSFDLDAYEYLDENENILYAAGHDKGLISCTGFRFREQHVVKERVGRNPGLDFREGSLISGPIQSIIAVRESV